MPSIIFSEPADALVVVDGRATSSRISGGGYRYEPNQYMSSGGFEGSTSLWAFKTSADVDIDTPTSTAVIDYTEAQEGNSCLLLTINDSSEQLTARIAASKDERITLNEQDITFEFYVKNASADMFAFIRCYGTYTPTGSEYLAIPVSASWQKVSMTRSFSYSVDEPDINDIKIAVGFISGGTTPVSAYIDNVSVYTPNDLSDVPVATYITLSPVLTVVSPESYIGSYVVVIGGLNNRYGSVIQEIDYTGSDISTIWVYDIIPFDFASDAGVPEYVALLTPNYNRRYDIGRIISVDEFITRCTTESDIEVGYSKCAISLSRNALSKLGGIELLDWDVTITDEYGILWRGYVVDIAVNESEISITGTGYRTKLDGVYYTGYYDSEPVNTTPTIIRDILSLVPDIEQNNDASIDRDNVIYDLQYASGGIGPIDFSQTPAKASECIRNVLSLGAFDDDFSPIYLQFWGTIPELVTINRSPVFDDVVYEIDSCFVPEKRKTEYTSSLDALFTGVFSVYNDFSGAQLETPRLYDLQNLIKYGILEKNLSGGSKSLEEADIHLNVSLDDVVDSVATGNVTVDGLVRMSGSGFRVSSAHIRAGDVIFVPEIIGNTAIARDINRGYEIFRVGNISCDLIGGTASITPYSQPERVEYSMALLDIDTGG